MPKFTLNKSQRIRKSFEFVEVQRTATKCHAKNFIILLSKREENNTPPSRIGITITTKISPRATVRNLLKRRIREIFRLNAHKLNHAFDIVIIARQNAHECSYTEIKKQILGTLSHNGYLVWQNLQFPWWYSAPYKLAESSEDMRRTICCSLFVVLPPSGRLFSSLQNLFIPEFVR